MSTIQQDLYRAYEIDTMAVIRRQNLSDVVGSREDLYDAHLFSVEVLGRVGSLGSAEQTLIRAKFGRSSDDLSALSQEVQTAFDLPQAAARIFVAYWLGDTGVQLQWLTDVLGCSKSTVSRKCHKVCLWLDAREAMAMAAYSSHYLLDNPI